MDLWNDLYEYLGLGYSPIILLIIGLIVGLPLTFFTGASVGLAAATGLTLGMLAWFLVVASREIRS